MNAHQSASFLPLSAAAVIAGDFDPNKPTIEDYDRLRNPRLWADDPYTSYTYFAIGDGGAVSMTENFKFNRENLSGRTDQLFTILNEQAKTEGKTSTEVARDNIAMFVARLSWLPEIVDPVEKFVSVPVPKNRNFRETEVFWYVRCYGLCWIDETGQCTKEGVTGYSYFSMTIEEAEAKLREVKSKFNDSISRNKPAIRSVEIFIDFEESVRPEFATYTVWHNARDFVISSDTSPMRYPAHYRASPEKMPVPIRSAFEPGKL